MKTRLEARNEFEILARKELLAQKEIVLEVLKQFDGKVVNIKLNKAINALMPSNIVFGGEDWYYIKDQKYTGIKLINNNRWWSTGGKTSGGCTDGGYIQSNEVAIPLIKDENGRLLFEKTNEVVRISFGNLKETISQRENAMFMLKEEQEYAQSIKDAIREYNNKFHYSIRMTSFNDRNETV